MTEREQALQIFSRMYVILFDRNDAKDCSIISAEVVRDSTKMLIGTKDYWNKVIEEIKKI